MVDMGRRHVRHSDHERYWHVAIVFRHGRAISVGVNTGWNHAEKAALGRVANPKGCNILSLRFSSSGHLRMARPCEECRALMQEKKLRRVTYSDWRGSLTTEFV